MTTAAKPSPIRTRAERVNVGGVEHLKLEFRAPTEAEPMPGFCGQLRGIALPYGVVDSYRTVFAPGCLDKTRAAKVGARKVKLFLDHSYGVKDHVGTVLEMPDAGDAALLVAGILDTPDGRAAKEYLQAILASGSETGLSVGFYVRKEQSGQVDGQQVTVFNEIELDEVSLTPRNAVPGAVVTGTRKDGAQLDEGEAETAKRVLRTLVETLPPDEVATIVAEVAAARDGDTPPSKAPETKPGAEPAPASNASGEDTRTDPTPPAGADTSVAERIEMVRRHMSPS